MNVNAIGCAPIRNKNVSFGGSLEYSEDVKKHLETSAPERTMPTYVTSLQETIGKAEILK